MLPGSKSLSPQEVVNNLDKRLSPTFKRNNKGKLFILIDSTEALKWYSSGVEISFSSRITEHYLQLWTTDGIGHALEDLQKVPTRQTIKTILKETSGHHLLVGQFLSSLPTNREINPGLIRKSAQSLRKTISDEKTSYIDKAGIATLPDPLKHPLAEVIDALVTDDSPDSPLTVDDELLSLIVEELRSNSKKPSDSHLHGIIDTVNESSIANWMRAMGHTLSTHHNRVSMSHIVHNLYASLTASGPEN